MSVLPENSLRYFVNRYIWNIYVKISQVFGLKVIFRPFLAQFGAKIGISMPHAVSISRLMGGPNLVMFVVLETPGTYPGVYFSLFRKIVSEAHTSPLKMVQNVKIGILVPHAVSIFLLMVGPNLVMFAVL